MPTLGDCLVTYTPPYDLLHVEDVPVRKHRAVDTSVQIFYSAVPALADTALHAPLERHEDLVLGYAQLDQMGRHEPVHRGRTADHSEGVLAVHRPEVLEQLGDDSDLVWPLAGIVLVHREQAVQVLPVLELDEFLPEQHLTGQPRAMQICQLSELISVVQDVQQQ